MPKADTGSIWRKQGSLRGVSDMHLDLIIALTDGIKNHHASMALQAV